MDLSYVLQKFASEKVGFYLDINSISPDGDDFDKMEGIINWYVTDKVSEEQQRQIIQEWIQEMQLLDYKIKVTGPDVSGLNESGFSPGPGVGDESTLMVYRIHVLQNGSLNYMQVPDMNVSNVNAQALMTALGVPFDYVGSIDLHELKTKLEMFTPYHRQELVQDPTSGGEEGKVEWYDAGRSEDRVDRYIDNLTRMVDFGIREGFKTLQWY